MKVGDLVRLNREKKGITQTELGKRLGLSRSAMSRLEGGQRKISTDILLRISQILDCPIEDLYPEDQKKHFEIDDGEDIIILDKDKENLKGYTKDEILEFIRLGQEQLKKKD